jgi:hypothetical protein
VSSPVAAAAGCPYCSGGCNKPGRYGRRCDECPTGYYSVNGRKCKPCEGLTTTEGYGTETPEACSESPPLITSRAQCHCKLLPACCLHAKVKVNKSCALCVLVSCTLACTDACGSHLLLLLLPLPLLFR